jgi:FkbM family methyltransferase
MMAVISYSQNFEDIILWRALKNIDNGFYIDIGANDPIEDSVSLLFYEHGWRGIHVEPTMQFSDKLRKFRPDEQVMQIALSNRTSSVTFYELPETGLSTLSSDIAREHEKKGFQLVETNVSQQTFDDAFRDISADTDIHWLKIDVEGAEQMVLEGWVNSPLKPWILVIESTLPLTQQENFENWEYMVLEKGYQFVYFDGLNRFYLSNAHLELKPFFSYPPNVFDSFIQVDLFEANKKIDYLTQLINEEKEKSLTLQKQLDTTLSNASSFSLLKVKLQIFNSKVKKIIKENIKAVIVFFIVFIKKHPKLYSFLLKIINATGLRNQLRNVYHKARSQNIAKAVSYNDLSPSAIRIHNVIKAKKESEKE